jgi:hypothetical protein
MRKTVVILTLLVAQPVHAAACHKYSRWYYPYPQTCHNNRYTAEFQFHNKLRLRTAIQPASLEVQKPELKWSATSPYPQVELSPNIVCTMKMSEKELGMCLLHIEMEKQREDNAHKPKGTSGSDF